MSNIIHSKPYRNWVRGALGLLYVQEGLYPFTDRVVKAEHARILKLQNLAPCSSCTVKKIKPAHASGSACIYDHWNKAKCNCRKRANRVCNTCSQLYDEIITKHRLKDPLWVTDASKWYTDHWQIAKCFTTTTTHGSNNTAVETDAAGLLSIIINGNFFQSEVQCNINPPHDIFSQVRGIRNKILHNSTLELSDTEVTSYLNDMIAVLEDKKILINDPSAQAAVKKLKEIVKDELVVTTKEETRAIQTALDAIKEAKQQCEESIRDLTAEKLKEFNETEEKSEDRMRELTEKGENLVKKATERSEKSIDKLTEEKQRFMQKQALETEQKIITAKESAVAEVRSTASSVFEEEYEPEVKRLKLKHEDHEQRIKTVEKKQSDLEEKQVDLLNRAQNKHQTRMDYLKQKQDLQHHLVELYQKHYVKTWLSPLMTQDNDVNVSDAYVSPNMVKEKKDDKDRNKLQELANGDGGFPYNYLLSNRHINRYRDIFRSRDGKNRRIYIIGDVGTGKSIFLKMMMQNWCRAITGNSENRLSDKNNISDISAFELLFYVPLQFMSGKSDDIAEMIKKHLEDYSTLIDNIFSNESESCLILADGLDEWTPPKRSESHLSHHETYGLPTSRLVRSATIITSSRPSARGVLDMKSSECDLKVKLLGVIKLKTMIEKYMALLGKSSSEDLYRKLKILKLGDLQKTPMLLQQITWMYCNGYAIDKSITNIYTHIVNIIFQWMCKDCEKRLSRNVCKSIRGLPLPKVFEEYSTCQANRDLIILLGKVAYDIFIAKDKSSVVLDRYRLKRLGLTEQDISVVVQVGILNEAKSADPTYTESQLSFIHTSYLEFFAAVYISSYCLYQTQTSQSPLINDIILRNTSAVELLRLENVLIMVCGLSPFLTGRIFECIHQVAYRDKQLMEYRGKRKPVYRSFIWTPCNSYVQQIQDTCFRCVSESNSTHDQLQLRVNLCDCIILTKAQLKMCISSVESVRFITILIEPLSHEQCTSLASFLSQAVSLQSLNLDAASCEQAECNGHSIDISNHERLQTLTLERCYQISVSGVTPSTYLKSCEIRHCGLSHEQCISLSSFLSQAVSLQSLNLDGATCMQAECDGHSIDLSHQQKLQSLKIKKCNQISVSGVTPTTSLSSCEISNCRLSHKQCTSLSSFLSQTVSLQSIDLDGASCMQAECDGHSIDLSHHEQLQRLKVERCSQVSVSGVTPTSNLKSCEISGCKLSHEQMTLLSSFLSQAVSLQSLDLRHVICQQADCDGHSMDLSQHDKIQRLQLKMCSQISVAGVSPTTNLKLCEINGCRLSHNQCTSLSSFLSQAVSLQSLDLRHVICKQVECNGHKIDLSQHERLQTLTLERCYQISVYGVTPTTNLNSCEISYCKLSHEQCTLLSLFLSQAVSLLSLGLRHVICKQAGCDGHSIDLSQHERLQTLTLERCYQISVYGVTPTTNLKSCGISYCTLSYEQCTPLSSFLSQTVLLQSLDLRHVICKQDGCDGHSIDLSLHKKLQRLKLQRCNKISVSGVISTTNLKSCEISGCKLSHEQMTSLSLFLSQAVSLQSLDLRHVICKQNECDGHCIDLSHQKNIQRLKLERCNQISVSGVISTPNLKSCEIRHCKLSHEQCTSLSSFVLQAVSLVSLDLEDVTCMQAGCDGHIIDLSHHDKMRYFHRQIELCKNISVHGLITDNRSRRRPTKYMF